MRGLSVTTTWHYFPSFGSYFMLAEGTLLGAPANLDGTRADEDYEVDFQRIGDREAAECLIVRDRLLANPANPDTSEVQL